MRHVVLFTVTDKSSNIWCKTEAKCPSLIGTLKSDLFGFVENNTYSQMYVNLTTEMSTARLRRNGM